MPILLAIVVIVAILLAIVVIVAILLAIVVSICWAAVASLLGEREPVARSDLSTLVFTLVFALVFTL